MEYTLTVTKVRRSRLTRESLTPLRERCYGLYPIIAERAGVTWFMVYAVLTARKTSARVLQTAIEVANERDIR